MDKYEDLIMSWGQNINGMIWHDFRLYQRQFALLRCRKRLLRSRGELGNKMEGSVNRIIVPRFFNDL